jgi:hypothetical protein
MDEIAEQVRRSLTEATRDEFERRIETQAAFLREEIESGALDNRDFAVGLELEAYATDSDGRLAFPPESVFEIEGCAGELGRHNVEINTAPQVLDEDGLDEQKRALERQSNAAQQVIRTAERELVLDAMWTIPPAEGTVEYLSTTEKREGVTLATNMRPAARYCALDTAILAERGGRIDIELAGISASFPSVLVESLTSSMQPHLQIPCAERFPAYYNVAIRTMGPVLALATNSPFAPADLYPSVDGDDAHTLVEETPHELRIPVFENSINTVEEGKVRFPGDIESATDVIERIVADRTCAPFLSEWTPEDEEAYADQFFEFEHKRGTYWRWLRGVIGGQPVDENNDERSLRIEYRPLPTQPSVSDTIGLQVLTVGLLRGLVAVDHPLSELSWEDSKVGFYDVVHEGPDADLVWMTADGERTGDVELIYEEIFEFTRYGLRKQDVSDSAIEEYLAPIEWRFEERMTPSRWKKARVREELENGATLPEAIRGMQREYIERVGQSFAEWV